MIFYHHLWIICTTYKQVWVWICTPSAAHKINRVSRIIQINVISIQEVTFRVQTVSTTKHCLHNKIQEKKEEFFFCCFFFLKQRHTKTQNSDERRKYQITISRFKANEFYSVKWMSRMEKKLLSFHLLFIDFMFDLKPHFYLPFSSVTTKLFFLLLCLIKQEKLIRNIVDKKISEEKFRHILVLHHFCYWPYTTVVSIVVHFTQNHF